ncbi:MAG: histidyl-tRNA synthetase [Ignavibacteria bacterium]|nr:histidyl-tRNA synthetase [Ignavibacteria bacterium]
MIQSVRGTKDILPDAISNWHLIEDVFRNISTLFGYEELRTPIFEKTEVFSRSIGETTDIVNKEMYTFTDRSGESLTLRPEMTAAIARSILQNSLLDAGTSLRIWYFGPLFRYERPQKGRFRQFYQYGAECIGSPNPESDAEVIFLAHQLFKSSGIGNYKLLINSLGSDENRLAYRNVLIKYFTSVKSKLSEDSLFRLENNPLRILDSKDEQDRYVIASAPQIIECLNPESKNHFDSVLSNLDASSIDYEISPRLVRGLDYYNHTVFEFQHSSLGAQDSFGGGGRYNGLFSQLGGKPTPAIGFALGVERMLLILENNQTEKQATNKTDVYIVTHTHAQSQFAQILANKLRGRNLKITTDLNRRSVKSQMREANRLGAKYTVIIGENEVLSGNYMIKNMSNGEQVECELDRIMEYEFNIF